ncbi:hypothetical protein Phum_PHUM498590 [Pediculus humanus corporis]|uniref:Uncharacterized protein n=1 Tax=Pediculus humanus subsp. corporis TaxID=121224 RepID=E0VXD6_PEDHC|nr:uncharacterized protein Phum_PHUM498590 [Pediculus humanus corporis]EEB18042.1 hypothetical protein Phum_PHUM498590 [Pediculus humanus corporis]
MLVKELGGGRRKNDDEGIEYENVMEKSKEDKEKETAVAVAENTIYFSDGGGRGEGVKENKKKNIEIKKSTVEIKISSSSCCDLSKKSQTNLYIPEHYSTPEPQGPTKTVKKDDLNLSDLCSIRFSFLDSSPPPTEDKSKEYVYDTIEETKTNVEETLNRDYVTVSDSSENVYSSPRTSLNSQTISGEFHTPTEYVTSDQEAGCSPDKSDGDSELFYATSEVLNLRPPTPYKKRKSSSDYEDLELEDEELPEIPIESPEINDNLDEYADVDVNDYCRHREENPKKLNLNPKDKKAIVKVRSKINKAWKSMKNWINEDREIRECSNNNVNVKKPLTIDVIKVLKKNEKDVDEDETDTTMGRRRSESPDSDINNQKFSFSNENIKFIDVEKRENSDSGTYMDMTRCQIPECSTDIFQSLTILRKKFDGSSSGTTPSLKKFRIYPETVSGDLNR